MPGRLTYESTLAAVAEAGWAEVGPDANPELDALMQKHRLFADSGLNLARLARRLSRPARAVSNAVNRLRGTSVSQYVNDFRVAEACRLLRDTEEPVTRILYDAGFMTKSNFNREFSRVTGMTPSDWRMKNASAAGRVAPASLGSERPPMQKAV